MSQPRTDTDIAHAKAAVAGIGAIAPRRYRHQADALSPCHAAQAELVRFVIAREAVPFTRSSEVGAPRDLRPADLVAQARAIVRDNERGGDMPVDVVADRTGETDGQADTD